MTTTESTTDPDEPDPAPILNYNTPRRAPEPGHPLAAVLGVAAVTASVLFWIAGLSSLAQTLLHFRADRLGRLSEIAPVLGIAATLSIAGVRWCREGFGRKNR